MSSTTPPPEHYIRVGSLSEFPPGQGRIVRVGRKPVAVFNVSGELYALNNICPHLGGPIGAGELNGLTVACPYHGMCFDLRTGRSVDDFGHSLQTYRVKIDGDAVLINAWWAKH